MKVYLVFNWYDNDAFELGCVCHVFKTYEAARAYIGDRIFFDTTADNHELKGEGDGSWWVLHNIPSEYYEGHYIKDSFYTILEKEI